MSCANKKKDWRTDWLTDGRVKNIIPFCCVLEQNGRTHNCLPMSLSLNYFIVELLMFGKFSVLNLNAENIISRKVKGVLTCFFSIFKHTFKDDLQQPNIHIRMRVFSCHADCETQEFCSREVFPRLTHLLQQAMCTCLNIFPKPDPQGDH